MSNIQADSKLLPDYVTCDGTNPAPKVLITEAKTLSFPLSVQDKQDIEILQAKFDQEENCAGLAAVQIGIAKKIIIFAADDLEIKKFRPDFTQTMGKTLWINPHYQGIPEAGYTEQFEGCFSVENLTGPVTRFNKISYQASDIEGILIKGTAEGYLARVMQHEIDHIHGKLCIDYMDQDRLMSKEEYLRQRKQTILEAEKANSQ